MHLGRRVGLGLEFLEPLTSWTEDAVLRDSTLAVKSYSSLLATNSAQRAPMSFLLSFVSRAKEALSSKSIDSNLEIGADWLEIFVS